MFGVRISQLLRGSAICALLAVGGCAAYPAGDPYGGYPSAPYELGGYYGPAGYWGGPGWRGGWHGGWHGGWGGWHGGLGGTWGHGGGFHGGGGVGGGHR
jgi:hypothetical protein